MITKLEEGIIIIHNKFQIWW